MVGIMSLAITIMGEPKVGNVWLFSSCIYVHQLAADVRKLTCFSLLGKKQLSSSGGGNVDESHESDAEQWSRGL